MDSLDKHFRKIARPALERYGFAHSELVAQWPAIAGDDLASRCVPDRIAWPRGRGETRRRTGATLTVRCDEGAGLALSHETARIAERVNSFYGYAAIADVKIVQGRKKATPAASSRRTVVASRAAKASVRRKLAKVKDENLRQALTRLGECVIQLDNERRGVS